MELEYGDETRPFASSRFGFLLLDTKDWTRKLPTKDIIKHLNNLKTDYPSSTRKVFCAAKRLLKEHRGHLGLLDSAHAFIKAIDDLNDEFLYDLENEDPDDILIQSLNGVIIQANCFWWKISNSGILNFFIRRIVEALPKYLEDVCILILDRVIDEKEVQAVVLDRVINEKEVQAIISEAKDLGDISK